MRRLIAVVGLASLLVLPFGDPGGAAELDGRRGGDVVVGGQRYVAVVPGSAQGPDVGRSRLLEGVGSMRIVSGDLNADGHEDLVLGTGYHGSVNVVPGSARGPRADRAYRIDVEDTWSQFGEDVIVSDVDRDGFDDVIAGYWHTAPRSLPVGEQERTKRVAVLWGSAKNVTRDDALHLVVRRRGFLDETPLLLDAGDVIGDRRREVAVVDPGFQDDEEMGTRAGTLTLCSISGTRTASCAAPVEVGSGIASVVVADVVGGRRDDVVLGWPRGYSDAGQYVDQLQVFRATPQGLAPRVMVTQDSPGVPGRSRAYDDFGSELAADDLDGDGKLDVAVASTRWKRDAGRVTVVYGHRLGLGQGRARIISQDTPGIASPAEPNDSFGRALTFVDVDANGRPDLVVGAPEENNARGSVTVVPTSSSGRLQPDRSRVIRPRHVGWPEEDRRWFGMSLGR